MRYDRQTIYVIRVTRRITRRLANTFSGVGTGRNAGYVALRILPNELPIIIQYLSFYVKFFCCFVSASVVRPMSTRSLSIRRCCISVRLRVGETPASTSMATQSAVVGGSSITSFGCMSWKARRFWIPRHSGCCLSRL